MHDPHSQEINLLPWRARANARRRRLYLVLLTGSVSLPCCLMLAVHLERSLEVAQLRAELAHQRFAIDAATAAQAEETRLISAIEQTESWLAACDQFLARRSLFVRLWQELATHLEASMHYRHVMLEHETVSLRGITRSSPDLATYLRRLEASPLFLSPRLIDLEDTALGHEFGITATIATLPESV